MAVRPPSDLLYGANIGADTLEAVPATNSIETVLPPAHVEPGPGSPETNEQTRSWGVRTAHTYAMQWNAGIQHMLTGNLIRG